MTVDSRERNKTYLTISMGHMLGVLVCGLLVGLLLKELFLFAPGRIGAFQPKHDDLVVSLSGNTVVSQSFLADSGKLQSVSFYYLGVTSTKAERRLLFKLYVNAVSQPLLTTTVNLDGDMAPGYQTIKIPKGTTHEPGQYRFTLENGDRELPDTILLAGRRGGSSTNGGLEIDYQPTKSDLAFVVSERVSLLDSLRDGLIVVKSYFAPGLLVAVVLICSALVILAISLPTEGPVASSTILAAVGASPLVPGLFLLFGKITGLGYVPGLVLLAGLLAALYLQRKAARLRLQTELVQEVLAVGVVLLVVLVLYLGYASGMPVPSYLDSVHHTLLTEQIAVNRGIPEQLSTEGIVTSLPYHYGVHALASAIVVISDADVGPSTALLVVGPFLIVIFCASVYSLMRELGVNRWPALAAIVLNVIAMSMPAQLLNWGKYPLLLALATCGALLTLLLQVPRVGRPVLYIFVGFLLASSVFAHTRMALPWFLFGTLLVLFLFIREGTRVLLPAAVVGATFLVVTILWATPMWQDWRRGQIVNAIESQLSNTLTPASDGLLGGLYPLQPVELLWVIVILVGFLYMGQYRMMVRALLALAVAAITLLALMPVDFLPTGTAIDPQFAHAALFLPITVGLGLAIDHFQAATSARLVLPSWFVPMLIGAIAITGPSARPNMPSICCWIATEHDIEAMSWIQASTMPTDRFAVAVTRWPSGQAVGVDGGYWISTLTLRKSTVPTLLYGFADPISRADLSHEAFEVDQVVRVGGNICDLGIDYVYVGNSEHSFDAEILMAHPNTSLAFESEPVSVFAVQGCE